MSAFTPLIGLTIGVSLAFTGAASGQCLGDCTGDGRVTIDELVVGVGLALDRGAASACPAFDPDGDDRLTIADLVAAVRHALDGCGAVATPTVPPCAARSGGALISFAVCEGETLTVWSTADAFITQARALLASGDQRIPIFSTLLEDSDCDPQWTWHPAPADMAFAEFTIELCDGCPSHIEADKPYWFDTVRQYCPWSARVTLVDDRR